MLHGDDKSAFESGLHFARGDCGRGYTFGDLSVDTVADGIFHIGFKITGNRFENEDGRQYALAITFGQDGLGLFLNMQSRRDRNRCDQRARP